MVFKLDDFNLSVFVKNEEILFHARSVAEKLGYKDPSDAYNVHCKSLIFISSGDLPDLKSVSVNPRGEYFIKESDLYRLIMRSKLESAVKFQDWVVEEVLPSIRKTGAYSEIPKTQGEILLEAVGLLVKIEKEQARQAEAIAKITAKQTAFEEGLSYFTVLGYAAYRGITIDLSLAQKIGKDASALSKEKDIPIDRTKDVRFGMVNSYHEKVLDEVIAGML